MGGKTDPRSGALRVLAGFIDAVQDTEGSIREISFDDGTVFAEDRMQAEVAIDLPELSAVTSLNASLESDDLTMTEDGACLLETTVEVPFEELSAAEGSEQTASTPEGETGVDDTAPREGGRHAEGNGRQETTKTDGSGGESPASVRPQNGAATVEKSSPDTDEQPGERTNSAEEAYKDPERLRAVYEEYDTFPEMRDALDADVTAQTVRRHMIKHGIHEVSSNTALEALRDIDDAAQVLGTESANDPSGSRSNRTAHESPHRETGEGQSVTEIRNR